MGRRKGVHDARPASFTTRIDRVIDGLRVIGAAYCLNPAVDLLIAELTDAKAEMKYDPPRLITEDVKLELIGMYTTGASAKTVGQNLGITPTRVLKVLRDSGVYVRTGPEQTSLNHGTTTIEDD